MGGVLLKGGCVLSLDKRVGNLREADVLIEDGRVAEIGRGLRSRDAETVDATDRIVMPGMVDTHRHTWKTLLRNLGGASHADPATAANHGQHCEPDDVYAATLTGLLSAIAAGITTVVDISDIQIDDRYTDAALQAHADAGLRSVFVPIVPDWARAASDRRGVLRRIVADRADSTGALTTIAAGSGDLALSRTDELATDWALARELGLRIHAHAGIAPADRGVVARLGQQQLLADDVTLAHATGVSDDDLDAIVAHDVAVSSTPASEMAGGLGFPPVQDFIDHGIRPGLGVDDELVTPGDLFAQMRSFQSLQHATVFDLKLAGKAGVPELLSTREVIRYATVDGAKVAGLGDLTGSLVPGKQADIIVLRTDRPNIFPVNDPIGAVVWGMDVSNIDWVFVGGRPLLRAGILDADVGRARELAITARKRLAAAVGPLVETSGGGAT